MLRHKRGFAIAFCVLTALTPVTALAEGLMELPETAPVQQETTVETPESASDMTTTELSLTPETPLDDETMPLTETAPPDGTAVESVIAPEQIPAAAEPAGPSILFNGQPLVLDVRPVNKNGTLFVPVRAFCEALGCTVNWIPDSNGIYITRSDLTLMFTINSVSVWSNRRNWYMSDTCQIIDGNAMVPVRALAKIFSCTVSWSGAEQIVRLSGGEALATAEEFYDEESLLWLARIIWCEAGNQPLTGKVAVGNVILNRVNSPAFPNTIYEVIFDRRCGVQFTPTSSGRIYCTPTEACYTAAKLALEGYETAPGCLYFVSLRNSTTCWAARNRTRSCTIGGHVFFL